MSEFLKVLPVLACPVGMGAMMWFMMRSGNKNAAAQDTKADPREQELAALRAEVDGLRNRVMPEPAPKDREQTR
ncbi:hypothetical protein [Streptomyces sp. NPDC052535]|uniref:hypothetical protein n=1 Tax=Streptomyces sp. NPDC052535 TaxID=3155531 RepID=UPI003412A2D9